MGIRSERPGDEAQIRRIHGAAFETEAEADLVDRLRDSGVPSVSLVYEENDRLVGHILFTPVVLLGDTSGLRLMGLAPMAVVPAFQNQGIGSALARAGIAQCTAEGYDALVVLGHPSYYPKFGFVPSAAYGIRSEYDVPDEVFMVLVLRADALQGRHGVIRFHEAFGRL